MSNHALQEASGVLSRSEMGDGASAPVIPESLEGLGRRAKVDTLQRYRWFNVGESNWSW